MTKRRRIVTVDSGDRADEVYTQREQLRPAPTKPRQDGNHPTEYIHARERVKQARTHRVVLRPHIGQLLGDAYHVAAAELSAMRQKTMGGEELTSQEASKFQKVTDSVVKLMREERAQEDRSDPAQLSDAQLLEQAEEAKRYLEVLVPEKGGSDEE